MPELPEVETIVGDLAKKLTGKAVTGVVSYYDKALNLPPLEFKNQVAGLKVKSVWRRAKMIILDLGEKSLVCHLKMTGQLVYRSKRSIVAGGHPIKGAGRGLPNKFTRVVLEFNDDSKLYFNDVRKFGWIKLVNVQELNKFHHDLGIEPLSQNFNLDNFKRIMARKQNTTIKQALMDQKNLSGLGNIYADESLFAAGIKPMRRVKTLTNGEIKKLWQAIPKMLYYAIKHRGTSFNDYVDAQGEVGNFIKYLKVYGRAGLKCKRCGGVVSKMKLGGRGTHWCDKCQN